VWYENFAAWARAHPSGVAETRAGWRIASMGSPWPFYNVATAVSDGFAEAGGSVEALDEALAGVSGYRVWLRDGMDDADRALRDGGFDATDELPALWMPLETLDPAPMPEGYHLIPAESDDDVVACMLGDRWAGYMDDAQVAITFPDPAAMAKEGDRSFYLARQGETLVATGQTVAIGGVVGVFGMWTAERHRRRGVASAILGRAMADARDAGQAFAALQAAEAAVGVYQRAGFQPWGHYRIYRPPLY
jgi:GNAT superfamily N-acetyltransferase